MRVWWQTLIEACENEHCGVGQADPEGGEGLPGRSPLAGPRQDTFAAMTRPTFRRCIGVDFSEPETRDGGVTSAPGLRARKNPLSPKKLLLTKWTAVKPRNREKHFVVTRVIEPELPSTRVEQVELEAVHSKQVYVLHWRELTDASLWHQGWT